MNIETYARKHPKMRQGVILPENIAAMEKLPGSARILDIGCAEGHTLRHLRALFPDKFEYHSPSGWALDPTHLREYTAVDELAAQFPPALKIDSVLLQKTYRRLNIIRSLSFLPNWMKLRVPGYYVLFLSGHKAERSPN